MPSWLQLTKLYLWLSFFVIILAALAILLQILKSFFKTVDNKLFNNYNKCSDNWVLIWSDIFTDLDVNLQMLFEFTIKNTNVDFKPGRYVIIITERNCLSPQLKQSFKSSNLTMPWISMNSWNSIIILICYSVWRGKSAVSLRTTALVGPNNKTSRA